MVTPQPRKKVVFVANTKPKDDDVAPDANDPGDDTLTPELEALVRPDDVVPTDEVDQPHPEEDKP